MPSSTETEKYAEWVYLKMPLAGWVVDRAVSTSKQIHKPGGRSFWISQRNDRFGIFDVIALSKTDAVIDLVQVTMGKTQKVYDKKSEVKKWWRENDFDDALLSKFRLFVFAYRGSPRKHFERWRLFPTEKGVKWEQMTDVPIPKKEEVIQ